MNSCIYEGSVRHRRLRPVEHQFRQKLFFLYFDLNELDRVFRGRLLWSTQRIALARFRRADHLGNAAVPLTDAVRELLVEAGHANAIGSIRLLTQLRQFGYVFNPLSLFYCFNTENQLDAVVAEVSNTPWGERHCYVLESTEPGSMLRTHSRKEFHVSPFMPMDVAYRWQLSVPQDALAVTLENWRNEEKFFDVTMQLRRRSLSTTALAEMLLKYPLLPQQVIASIYWQAFRLWWKRTPFHPHPRQTAPQTPEQVP